MQPRDGRLWALNHTRLVLKRDIEKANRCFETFAPLPGDADTLRQRRNRHFDPRG